MNNSLILLCGLPGSGKTTWAKSMASAQYTIISSDDIREELWGDSSKQADPALVFSIMNQRTEDLLRQGKSIIYDATNLNAKKRKALLNRLKNYVSFKKCIIFATLPETCILRQFSRGRKVPSEAILRMSAQFQTPYYNEGWDEIEIIRNENAYVPELETSFDMDQECPKYHSYSLKEHQERTLKFVENELKPISTFSSLSSNLILSLLFAARYHDIGKTRTKTFKNRNGQIDESAHFYGHENVGALLFLCDSYFNTDIALTTALLINYHMIPYSLNDSTTIEDWASSKGFDSSIGTAISILHRADKS